jgi:hypothetical protein
MPKPLSSEPLQSLADVASREKANARPVLLRALTQLYVQKPAHTAEEERQYTELALGLISGVDITTRIAIEVLLRNYPNAPSAVLDKLFQLHGVRSQQTSASSAGESRSRPPAQDLIELFFAANPEERRLILTNLDVAPHALEQRTFVRGETALELERAALAWKRSEFSRILERALRVSQRLAERIVSDPSGEPLVIVAKAVGMHSAALQRILLVLNPTIGQSVSRVFSLSQLFEELPVSSAMLMVSVWHDENNSSSRRYEPLNWNDDERHQMRSSASDKQSPKHAANELTQHVESGR